MAVLFLPLLLWQYRRSDCFDALLCSADFMLSGWLAPSQITVILRSYHRRDSRMPQQDWPATRHRRPQTPLLHLVRRRLADPSALNAFTPRARETPFDLKDFLRKSGTLYLLATSAGVDASINRNL